MTSHVQQVDSEMAMQLLFQGKHAVNRAAHAAAQQLDESALTRGQITIHPQQAREVAAKYLQSNLALDSTGQPLPGSFVRDRVEVLVFEVISEGVIFPYTYKNDQYDYEVTLDKPGVILIIKLAYPRQWTALARMEWEIKGAAELILR
ncbi:hypothetical protein ACFO9Q_10075 [Paenibacillus sp. GCM10023252]|uniref:hypothetical protein n=1 Tax=Paenibacillus sp. GCM10023252 TaxID=3252649 RepID=UPI00361DC1CC